MRQGEHVNSSSVTSCRTVGETSAAVLPVVPVVISSPLRQVQTYAFLDSGSTHSFISASLFQELEMDITPSRRLSLTTVDRDVSVETQVAEGVVITDLQGENQLRLPSLFTLKSIPVTESDLPTESELHKWEHLRELTLPKLKSQSCGTPAGFECLSVNFLCEFRYLRTCMSPVP